MAAFSATDVAFEGFRITRERPLDVLAWVVLFVVLQACVILIGGPAMGDMMTEMQRQVASGGQPDPQRVMAAYSRMGPVYAILTPISLIIQTLIQVAVFRAVLRPQERGVAGMRLGADELRVLAVSFAIALLLGVGGLVAALLVGAIAGGIGAAAGGGVGILIGIVLGIAMICGLIFVGVRLSLATPMTFAAKDFRVFESWRETQGRFWPLLGSYLLAFVMGLLVSILIGIISMAVVAAVVYATGGAAQPVTPEGAFDASFYTRPAGIVTIIFQGLSSAFMSIILFAPPAAALRALRSADKAFD